MKESIRRHFFYRSEFTRTTWKLRLGLLILLVAAVWLTRPWWAIAVARSLVCEANAEPSDAILVENLDPDYLLFERATRLRRTGMAPRVLVPVWADNTNLDEVALATAELMANISHLGEFEIVPVRVAEPISLNAAHDVLFFLQRERIRSAIVVAPIFRSRRSALVYESTLGRAGITVRCEPVEGASGVETWTNTWHGVQNVTEQWVKLLYYRLYVLPFGSRAPSS